MITRPLRNLRCAASLVTLCSALLFAVAPTTSAARPSQSLERPFTATVSLTGSFEVNDTSDYQPECDWARTVSRRMTTSINVPPITMSRITPAGYSPGGLTRPIPNAYTHETVVLSDTGRVYKTGPRCPQPIASGDPPTVLPVCPPTTLPMVADIWYIQDESAQNLPNTMAVRLEFKPVRYERIDAACQAGPVPRGVWPLVASSELNLLVSPNNYSDLRAPLFLSERQFARLKPGRIITRTTTVSGPCAKAVVSPWPAPPGPGLPVTELPFRGPADGCTVSGSYTVTFTRTPSRKKPARKGR